MYYAVYADYAVNANKARKDGLAAAEDLQDHRQLLAAEEALAMADEALIAGNRWREFLKAGVRF